MVCCLCHTSFTCDAKTSFGRQRIEEKMVCHILFSCQAAHTCFLCCDNKRIPPDQLELHRTTSHRPSFERFLSFFSFFASVFLFFFFVYCERPLFFKDFFIDSLQSVACLFLSFRFGCSSCGLKFSNCWNFWNHMCCKKVVCSCGDRKLYSETEYQQHFETHLNRAQDFCLLCNKFLPTVCKFFQFFYFFLSSRNSFNIFLK